jgi:hypothetical protein
LEDSIRDSEQRREGLEEMIQQEGMPGDPDRQVKAWLDKYG